MNHVVGIDLGTSNSCVASLVDGKHQILLDENGNGLTPSVVSFGKDKKFLVGNDAKAQVFSNPKRTISSIKRLIGRKFFSPEVKKAQALLPYTLIEGPDQNVCVEIDQTLYSPQEISGLILKHLRTMASRALHSDVEHVVVTVPAHFNDNQRQATKDACKIAGLEAMRIINEPTAAALAYGFGKGLKETVAIYDLGGGTFDISILKLRDQVFEVISTAGDTFLGGDDFDDRVIDLCAEDFLAKTKIDLRKISGALPLLRTNAERAKRKLSYAEKTDIYIPGIIHENGQPLDLQLTLTREQFYKATEPLIQRTFTVCDEALRLASLKLSDLDAVILVGGPTKMSLVFDVVGSYFGKAPLRDLNPDEVVAIGASIQAHTLAGSQKSGITPVAEALLLDVTPLDLGLSTVGGYVETLVEANTPIPAQASKVFTTTADNQETVLIKIFQGKNRREEESQLLGHFEFSGFKKAKAGSIGIEVFFSINTDGIVEVTAKDQETGIEQKVSVKLSGTLSQESLQKTADKFEDHKQVKVKNELQGALKVVVCSPSKGGPIFDEGFSRDLDPLAHTIALIPEDGKNVLKKHERKNLCWTMVLEDFSNTPRYLQYLSEIPTSDVSRPGLTLYKIKFKDGGIIYGESTLPDLKSEGFWIQPPSGKEILNGKIFVYTQFIQEMSPHASS